MPEEEYSFFQNLLHNCLTYTCLTVVGSCLTCEYCCRKYCCRCCCKPIETYTPETTTNQS